MQPTPKTAAQLVAELARGEVLLVDPGALDPELRQLGYSRVAHLDGGFTAWTASGREITAA